VLTLSELFGWYAGEFIDQLSNCKFLNKDCIMELVYILVPLRCVRKNFIVEFEVLTVVDVTPCSPLKVNQHFRGTYCFHLQGWRINWARYQLENRWQAYSFSLVSCSAYSSMQKMASSCFHTGILLGIFFYPEDGGDMFLRNVGLLSTDYTALCQRK
jgi:hypothetical protein